MAECRDWLKTLWSASYKGMGFFFESDDEEGGRGLVIHEFPNRDNPYVEDLGEAPRYFAGVAYVHGDQADRAAVALSEMFATRGSGTLVIPVRGPVQVHCQSFTRQHRRDQLGYVAFQVRFVRAGASFGLISIPHLASQAFSSAGGVITAAAGAVAQALSVLQMPDYVLGEAIGGLQDALLAVDGLRLTNPLDLDVSARLRDAIDLVHDLTPSVIVRTALADAAGVAAIYAAVDAFASRPTDVVSADDPVTAGPFAAAFALGTLTRTLADAMAPETAMRAMRELADASEAAPATSYPSVLAQRADDNRVTIAQAARVAALTAFAEAAVRRDYPARPEGVGARAEIAIRFEAELERATGAANAELFVALQALRGRAVEYLTRLVNDLAPVINVEARRSMPALWWSWRLYSDPNRDGELVARNRVPHPSFMPMNFKALAR